MEGALKITGTRQVIPISLKAYVNLYLARILDKKTNFDYI
jgi:hypothetical protein